MKKLILLFFVAAMCVGCVQEEYFTYWKIKNSTTETLLVSPSPFYHYSSNILFPGGECEYYYREDINSPRPDWVALLVNWQGWEEKNINLELLSTDGTIIKTWKYSTRDSGGNQFFNRSSWDLTYYTNTTDDPRSTWTFEILPEDIR